MFTKLATLIALTLCCITAAFATPKVGIIQFVEHPALDKTREGIIDTLTKKGINPKDIVWESAQGNPTLSTQIAQKFVGQEASLILAIGTLPAQTALAQTKKIPIVYASVTDPKGAKLVGNITGVSNFVAPSKHFAAMRKLYPEAKSVGVIYNAGEPNSVSLLTPMKEAAKVEGFELVEATVSRTSEVVSATKKLMGNRVDVIFINNDSTAIAGFEAIVTAAQSTQTPVPVFASDTDLLDKGANATFGPNQYDIGCQAGQIASRILLEDKKPSDFAVEYPKSVELKKR